MEISLQELAGGALQEKVNQAFEKVMQNMQDPNTPWKNKRKIKQIPDNQTLSGISFFLQVAKNSRFKHIIGG